MRTDVLVFVVFISVMKKLSVEIQYREVLENKQSGFFDAFCKGEVQDNLVLHSSSRSILINC